MNRIMEMHYWDITARLLSSLWKTGVLLSKTLTVLTFSYNFFVLPTAFEFLSSRLRFEQAFVNSLLSESGANSSTSYWIDLTDMDDIGEYRWRPHNGSSLPLTFTNWNKHQPGRQL